MDIRKDEVDVSSAQDTWYRSIALLRTFIHIQWQLSAVSTIVSFINESFFQTNLHLFEG